MSWLLDLWVSLSLLPVLHLPSTLSLLHHPMSTFPSSRVLPPRQSYDLLLKFFQSSWKWNFPNYPFIFSYSIPLQLTLYKMHTYLLFSFSMKSFIRKRDFLFAKPPHSHHLEHCVSWDRFSVYTKGVIRYIHCWEVRGERGIFIVSIWSYLILRLWLWYRKKSMSIEYMNVCNQVIKILKINGIYCIFCMLE